MIRFPAQEHNRRRKKNKKGEKTFIIKPFLFPSVIAIPEVQCAFLLLRLHFRFAVNKTYGEFDIVTSTKLFVNITSAKQNCGDHFA